MKNDKLKQDFIDAFGEEKWKQEEMLSKLMPIHRDLCKFLGIEMVPVIFEDIEEDSRFYFKEQYIIISTRMLPKYSDVVKSLVHEVRHGYQYHCMFDPNSKEKPILINNWLEDFGKLINPLTLLKMGYDGNDYLLNTMELDAHAFSKWYLKEKLFIETHYPQPEYDEILDAYIRKYFN